MSDANFNWPESEPLDVRSLTSAIVHAVQESIRDDLRAIERSVQHYTDCPSGRFYIDLPINGAIAQLHDRISQAVALFDGMRTEHLKFLKSELIRMHNLTPSPRFVISCEHKRLDEDGICRTCGADCRAGS